LRVRRCPVQRILLGLDPAACPGVRPTGETLRNEAGHSGGRRRGQQTIGARGPQLVRRSEVTVELPQVAAHPGQRRHLMNDHVRCGTTDCRADGDGIQAV
jgi:hypothetical protein